MMEKDLNEWTRKEFEAVPRRKWNEDIGEFISLVILPERYKHDSGYACMSFVAFKGNKPVAKLGGGSDVIHIGGIAGSLLTPKRETWSIDCLRKSKLLRIFGDRSLTCGADLSSFEIFNQGERK